MKAFGNYHPFVLMVYFLSVLLTAMFVSNPVLQLCALAGGILFCLMLQKRSRIPGNIGFYVPLFLIVITEFHFFICIRHNITPSGILKRSYL